MNFQGKIETVPGCYSACYENVGRAIRGEAELIVKPEEARNTIRLIEWAVRSNAEKCTVAVSWNP